MPIKDQFRDRAPTTGAQQPTTDDGRPTIHTAPVAEDVLVQGATYDGDDVIDGSEKSTEEPSKAKSGIAFGGLWGRYKMFIIIGVVVLFVVLIAVLVSVKFVYNTPAASDEEIDLPPPPPPFSYSFDEREALRLAGYTGSEIEELQIEEKPAQELVDEMTAKRREQYDKEVAPYLNAASDEFKQLQEMTWISQAPLEYNTDTSTYKYNSYKLNADYEKLPAYGNQLWLKFYLNKEKTRYAFMLLTPERYATLEDAGNIVLEITYTDTSDKSIITNIREVTP